MLRGTSSASTIWKNASSPTAIQKDTTRSQASGRSPSSDSAREESIAVMAGSPTAPSARPIAVMPTWMAARYSSMWASISWTMSARRLPFRASISTRAGRTRTSAYSSSTKNALAAMSRPDRSRTIGGD
jgi:hypothetical protein